MSVLISTLDDITPQWLSEVLKSNGVVDTQTVTGVEHKLIGTGKMGDNARLSLQYEGQGNGPASMIAKIPALDETARMMASGLGAYKKEVSFYQHLAAQTNMLTAEIYHSDIDAEGSEFILLMEDLAPAEPGSQLIGESPERAERAVIEAAKLHAAFLNKEDILTQDYVTQSTAEGAAFGQELLVQNWPGFVDRFGDSLNAPCIALGAKHIENYAQWAQRFDGDTTLIHSDFRSENLLFSKSGAPWTVDWQTIQRSSPLADVAYFMGGSVDSDARRDCEKNIVERYRVELDKSGVSMSFNDCWQQYREFSMHGIMVTVLGAMFSAAEQRSDQMFLTMIQRHLQHAVDMNAEEFL